jgi:nitrate/nitrite transport system substrate-binding protein
LAQSGGAVSSLPPNLVPKNTPQTLIQLGCASTGTGLAKVLAAPLRPNQPSFEKTTHPMSETTKTSPDAATPQSSTDAAPGRRQFVTHAAGALGAAGLMSLLPVGVRSAVYAQGSDKPEKTEIKVGFIPLTDCASVVLAATEGFDKKYGIKIIPSKEASWAAVRDKLINGELDAAHVLYGLVYGVHLGVAGPKKDMAVLMTINQNGQGITLSNQLKEKGVKDGASLKAFIDKEKRDYTFAQTFPTGTHAMWLYYWLASFGINPIKDVKTITVPPPQMVANMRVGNMDGYCVGEPWNARAIFDKIGFSAATSQDVWKDHPEKVLGTTGEWAAKNPNSARALIAAVLDASRYIDTMANRSKVASIIADKSYVNTAVEVIDGRLNGKYENGMGKTWQDPNLMRFFNDGAVTYPYVSDGMWFLTQHKRWGLMKDDPDYLAVARAINKTDLYAQGAAAAKVTVPKDAMRSSTLIDGAKWDGKDPKAYAASFKVRA